jgi:ribosomal protein L37E
MSIKKLTCLRCGWTWYPRSEEKSRSCPNPKCRSVYWDKPKRAVK